MASKPLNSLLNSTFVGLLIFFGLASAAVVAQDPAFSLGSMPAQRIYDALSSGAMVSSTL